MYFSKLVNYIFFIKRYLRQKNLEIEKPKIFDTYIDSTDLNLVFNFILCAVYEGATYCDGTIDFLLSTGRFVFIKSGNDGKEAIIYFGDNLNESINEKIENFDDLNSKTDMYQYLRKINAEVKTIKKPSLEGAEFITNVNGEPMACKRDYSGFMFLERNEWNKSDLSYIPFDMISFDE